LILERVTGAGYAVVENRRWFLIDVAFGTDDNGNHYTEILARDQNILLDGYIVAYQQGSGEADKTDQFDDICKRVVIENMITPTDTTRTLSGITTDTGTGDAGDITVSLANKSLLSVCREMADGSFQAGIYLVFDFVNTGPGTYEMRTYIGQRGADHGKASQDPRLITLRNARLESNLSNSANVVRAGGMGSKAARVIKTATNSTSVAYSKFARREVFVSASGVETEAAVQAFANAELWRRRQKMILTGVIEDTPGMQYGLDYSFGDIVVAQYQGISIDCHIAAVGASYDVTGEKLTVNVRGEM
jgi:hypothetical protein